MEESLLLEDGYRGYRVSVRLVREGSDIYLPAQLSSPDDAYRFLRDIGTWDREVFYCVHLDGRHQVVSCEEISRGSLSASVVHPREVYKGAILSSAQSILVAHNHPSGDPTPSEEDRGITERLYRAGEILGIELLDHIVIGDGCFHAISKDSPRS